MTKQQKFKLIDLENSIEDILFKLMIDRKHQGWNISNLDTEGQELSSGVRPTIYEAVKQGQLDNETKSIWIWADCESQRGKEMYVSIDYNLEKNTYKARIVDQKFKTIKSIK